MGSAAGRKKHYKESEVGSSFNSATNYQHDLREIIFNEDKPVYS